MKIKIQTTLGDIIVRLYDETPVHRDNFLKLAKEGFYDGTLFHRVIKDFMIQGGDPDSKGAPAGKMLGVGDPGYTLEAEIKDGLFNKRGALAAARQGDEVNPERRSSGSQFYIVWGQVYNEGQLRQFSKQLRMQKVQAAFNELASEHRAEIMQMRRDRNRAGLQELQDKLAAEAESKVGKAGLTDEQFQNIIIEYYAHNKYPPKCARDLTEVLVDKAVEGAAIKPENALNTVREIISNRGGWEYEGRAEIYQDLKRYPALSETVHEFEAELRRMSANDTYTADRFRKAYEVRLRAGAIRQVDTALGLNIPDNSNLLGSGFLPSEI